MVNISERKFSHFASSWLYSLAKTIRIEVSPFTAELTLTISAVVGIAVGVGGDLNALLEVDHSGFILEGVSVFALGTGVKGIGLFAVLNESTRTDHYLDIVSVAVFSVGRFVARFAGPTEYSDFGSVGSGFVRVCGV